MGGIMDLEGQVAIVTGAGRGIGQAIARRFAEEGAGIAVIDIDRDAANETAEVIRARGGRAVAETADVSSPEQVKAAVADVVRELGRIDILVNNAGVEKRAPFFEITPDDWRQQLEVNLSGTFYCTQAAGREMAARRYGRVVNVSSVAGLIGPIDLAAYGAEPASSD
jgi:NAD(P)-dependent dehydrogenase (short-subunit alcohol dehydrogenase family)